MKHSLKILAAFLLLSAPAYAATDDGTNPASWFACTRNDECVVVAHCKDVAVNRMYARQLDQQQQHCNASDAHNPNAASQCANNKCVITLHEKKQ